MPVATIIRRDNQQVLNLDGLLSFTPIPSVRVSTHRVENEQTLVDNVERRATSYQLEAIVTQTPSVAGITTGPARIAEAIDFLDEIVGVPVDISVPDMPLVQNVLMTGERPASRSVPKHVRISLAFVEVRIATVTAANTGAQAAPSPSPRDDVAASRSELEDRGEQSTSGIVAFGQSIGLIAPSGGR